MPTHPGGFRTHPQRPSLRNGCFGNLFFVPKAGRELDGDARYRGEESTRDLTRSVRREVTKLSEKWAALWERAANLATQVSLAHKVSPAKTFFTHT